MSQSPRKALFEDDAENEMKSDKQAETDDAMGIGMMETQEVLSLDEAVDRLGMGWFQYRILIAAGLCFGADGMEILLLSFLEIVLQVEWGLSNEATSSIASSVFVGAFWGTLVLGRLADAIGRRPVFLLTAAIIAVFGILTATAGSLSLLLFCRFMVGFGVGGITVPYDTLSEFIPSKQRGRRLVSASYFWTSSTLLVSLLAFCSLRKAGNWRVFVALCSIPCIISTLFASLVLPESPRWLMTTVTPTNAVTRQQQSLAILRQAAKTNSKDPEELFPSNQTTLAATIRQDNSEHQYGIWRTLFAPHYWHNTLLLWALWGGYSFMYYGTVFVVTLVFSSESQSEDSYSFDYSALMISALAETAGVALVQLTVDRFGRIYTQCCYFPISGIMVLALCLYKQSTTEPQWSILVTIAFAARMFSLSASSITWITTVEILPTEIRTTGHSSCNAVARIGAFSAPYVVSNALPLETIGVILFAMACLLAIICYQLPETNSQPLGVPTTQTPVYEQSILQEECFDETVDNMIDDDQQSEGIIRSDSNVLTIDPDGETLQEPRTIC